ncbi:MAG TPA: hypothetical protein VMS17_10800 [Gemmataceae bacterium]|nr:hypothetical protein [Gemmataceae bacterium]
MQTSDDAVQPNSPNATPTDIAADKPSPTPFDQPFRTDVRLKRIRWRWWVLEAIGGLVMVGWGVAAFRDKHIVPRINARADDEAALQQKVAVALPLGSTKAQVVAWLNGQGIVYGPINGPHGKPVGLASRWKYSNWMGDSGSVRVDFYFDDEGKLKEEFVEIYTISL